MKFAREKLFFSTHEEVVDNWSRVWINPHLILLAPFKIFFTHRLTFNFHARVATQLLPNIQRSFLSSLSFNEILNIRKKNRNKKIEKSQKWKNNYSQTVRLSYFFPILNLCVSFNDFHYTSFDFQWIYVDEWRRWLAKFFKFIMLSISIKYIPCSQVCYTFKKEKKEAKINIYVYIFLQGSSWLFRSLKSIDFLRNLLNFCF